VVAVAALALFRLLFRITDADWLIDELTYRHAADGMVRGLWFINPEHPPLAKEILAIPVWIAGDGVAGLRVTATIAVLLTGVLIGVLGRDLADRWAGLGGAAIFLLLPWPFPAFDVTRTGLLDPFMVLFTTAALVAGLRWSRSGSWRWALVAGAAVGLAAACKLPGVLVAPTIAGLVLASVRPLSRAALQLAAAAAAAVVAFVVPFAPAGSDLYRQVLRVYDLQRLNAEKGHPTLFRSHPVLRPPWWAGPYDMVHGSPVLAVAVVICGALAVIVLERKTALYLLGAILGPFLFFGFIAGVQLPHYPYAYAPPLALGVALVIAASLRRPTPVVRIAGAVAAALLAVAIAIAFDDAVNRQRGEVQRVVAFVLPFTRPGDVIIATSVPGVVGAYLPAGVTAATSKGSRPITSVVAVVVDKEWAKLHPARRADGAYWDLIQQRVKHKIGTWRVYLLR
jgi:4-amino-4-deoxy-L-arabinose transferase-like glycosyltransferase